MSETILPKLIRSNDLSVFPKGLNQNQLKEPRYFYRIERITHRPSAEDKITIVFEVEEEDLQLARLLITGRYLQELQELQGKYSPESFNSYDTRKGLGFNYQLLLIDRLEEEVYLVESTMEKIESAVAAQKEEEKRIFERLGLGFSDPA